MRSETQLAKEKVKGCGQWSPHEEYRGHTGGLPSCGESEMLCDKCKIEVLEHLQSCRRFLEFLSDKFIIRMKPKSLEDKIKDLKQAIKIYEEAGIK